MKIKSIPQDFIVEEISNLQLDDNGKYAYYKLKKTNMTSLQAIQIIANHMKIDKKYINTAGTKDKVAVTTQFISISRGKKEGFKEENIELEFVGTGKDRLALGNLEGNKFTLTIRNISKEELHKFKNNTSSNTSTTIPNYYDDQRFGIQKNNHIIGKHMVKRKWKESVQELIKQDHYPNNLSSNHLNKHPTDFIGALRKIPKKLLLMFVYAYQSYLWNETVKKLIKQNDHRITSYNVGELYFPKKKLKQKDIPLIGFDIECDDEEINTILNNIMKKESIKPRDFIIRQMPELCASGTNRSLLIDLKDVSHKLIDNETVEIKFSLGKGSYATMVIKALFS